MRNLSDLIGGGGAAKTWVSGMTVQQRQLVWSPADNELYLRKTAAGGGATDPADDTTNYDAKTFHRVTALPITPKFAANPLNDPQYWAIGAVKTTSPAIAAGVRTQLYSATGRGTLQFGQLFCTSAVAPGNTRIEVIKDGFTVYNQVISGFSGGEVAPFAGSGAAGTLLSGPTTYYALSMQAIVQDILPFRRSLQIWVTPTSATALNGLVLASIMMPEA